MYGWRAKIGIMIPSSNTVFEQEFSTIVRTVPGVIGCTSRLLLESADAAGLQRMNQHIERAAQELATIEPDLVIYGCTSGSFVDGEAGDARLREQIQAIAGCPAVSISQAILEALHQLRAGRVTMLTPYDADLTRREIEFLHAGGIQVIDYAYRDLPDNLGRGAQPPEATFYHARRLNYREADAIFLSCSNIRTLEIIPALEAHSGKPVVASGPAVIWLALRRAGVHEPLAGFGRLFAADLDRDTRETDRETRKQPGQALSRLSRRFMLPRSKGAAGDEER